MQSSQTPKYLRMPKPKPKTEEKRHDLQIRNPRVIGITSIKLVDPLFPHGVLQLYAGESAKVIGWMGNHRLP